MSIRLSGFLSLSSPSLVNESKLSYVYVLLHDRFSLYLTMTENKVMMTPSSSLRYLCVSYFLKKLWLLIYVKLLAISTLLLGNSFSVLLGLFEEKSYDKCSSSRKRLIWETFMWSVCNISDVVVQGHCWGSPFSASCQWEKGNKEGRASSLLKC